MAKKVIVEISYSGRNFGAHVPILPGCVATGNTPEAVQNNIKDAIAFHVKGSLRDGDRIPKVFTGDYELAYKFDAESLLNYYSGIFKLPGLEKLTGINQKQLHHYTTGLKKPRPAQVEKIESALHKLGAELMSLEL